MQFSMLKTAGRAVLAIAMAAGALMVAPDTARALPTDHTVSTYINWHWNGRVGGGTFWGSTARGSQRHFDSRVNNSCGGTIYFNTTDTGHYEWDTAITGTSDKATIRMSSRDSRGGAMPYDPCDRLYHDYRLVGEIVATSAPRVISTTTSYILLERDAAATATFCMEPWFGSGGACTALTGGGTLRWKVPVS